MRERLLKTIVIFISLAAGGLCFGASRMIGHVQKPWFSHFQTTLERGSHSQREELTHFIKEQVQSKLAKRYPARAKTWRLKHLAREISEAIVKEASLRNLDPILVFSVIGHESKFNVNARGSHGEIGLMQLRPVTAKWIAHKFGLRWRGSWSLENPWVNVRLGAAYLSYLKRRVGGHNALFLAAYNMGLTKLHEVLSHHILPRIYAAHVRANYLEMLGELVREQEALVVSGVQKMPEWSGLDIGKTAGSCHLVLAARQ